MLFSDKHECAAQADELVSAHVLPGTQLYTDGGHSTISAWAHVNALSVLSDCMFDEEHQFVDPRTGVHINTVEGRNSLVKLFLKKRGGGSQSPAVRQGTYQSLCQQWFSSGNASHDFFFFFLYALHDRYGIVVGNGGGTD